MNNEDKNKFDEGLKDTEHLFLKLNNISVQREQLSENIFHAEIGNNGRLIFTILLKMWKDIGNV
jgi:tRNA U34 5-methylaminomethyl-2-thiouridine-forming methyltransferase MnmC